MDPFRTSRDIPASPERVFAAFSDAERLARWWGPAGFTNTFSVCEFRAGGQWSYVMHGPDGGTYANESIFAELEPASTGSGAKVVIEHVSKPKYRLTITLEASPTGTTVSWVQAFEKPDVARGIAHIVLPGNEQNLDRLTAEVLGETSSA